MALSFHHWDLQGDGTGLSDSPPSSLPTWHSASAPWPPCRSSEVAGSLLTWNVSHPQGSPPSFFTSSLRSPGVFPGWPTANMCALCYPSCSCFILALVLKHALRCYPCSSLLSFSLTDSQFHKDGCAVCFTCCFCPPPPPAPAKGAWHTVGPQKINLLKD